MSYDPGISYHGDKYIYDALKGLGEDAAKAIQENERIARNGSMLFITS